ncbi:MAG TPA: hypothetical protein VHD81_03630 [Mycobacteriales bacterium]|nr:hypothetical protein [Mycobacteriales bacterium]
MDRRRELTRAISFSLAVLAIPVALSAAFFVALLVPLGESPTVHNHEELRNVGFGYPKPWVHQDARFYGAPRSFPGSVEFGSPLEVVTSADTGAFLVDWSIFTGAILVVLLLAAGVIRVAGVIRGPTPTTGDPTGVAIPICGAKLRA